jgi:hypothetical protein
MAEQGNGYRQGEMSFREWLPTYEREQEHHSNQIAGLITANGQLSSEVATISANVQTLLNNQNIFTERLNRPWQWGVVVAALLGLVSVFGAFATLLNLTVQPMKANLAEVSMTSKERHQVQEMKLHEQRENQLQINMWMREYMEASKEIMIRNDERLKWLEMLEDRYNNRIEGHQ